MSRQPFPKTVLLCLVLLSAASVTQADWLDVTVESMQIRNLRTGQTGHNVSALEGDTIVLVCGYRVGLYGGHDLWVADREQHWEDRAVVDGVTLAVFRPSIPRGTQMGIKQTSGVLGISTKKTRSPRSISGVHPEVHWTAAGIGPHELRCVVNQPKGISDHVPNNNYSTGIVTVAARPGGRPLGKLKRPTVKSPPEVPAPAPARQPAVRTLSGIRVSRPSPAGTRGIDLAIEDALEVGGIATGWERTLTLTPDKTAAASDGYCLTYVDFVIRNDGDAESLPFEVLLTNDASPGRYSKAQAPMASDERSVQTARMILKPGRNMLNLKLDPNGVVTESERENNFRRLRIDLEGDCHATAHKPSGGGRR